jgi:hypothetical protein
MASAFISWHDNSLKEPHSIKAEPFRVSKTNASFLAQKTVYLPLQRKRLKRLFGETT